MNYQKLDKLIFLKEREINDELVLKHFLVRHLRSLLKYLKISKNNTEQNKVQVDLIKSELNNLKNQIKKISQDEKEIEKNQVNSKSC